MLTYIIAWLVLAGVIGALAHQRGRSGIGWFAVAAVLSPLLAALLLLAMRDAVKAPQAAAPLSRAERIGGNLAVAAVIAGVIFFFLYFGRVI